MNGGLDGPQRHQGVNGKKTQAPPSDSGITKNNNDSAAAANGNGNGVTKVVVGAGGVGKAPRKLTKNEKRRQKNKLKRAEAVEGALVDQSMVASNGVSVVSWPPPLAKEQEDGAKPDVQVCWRTMRTCAMVPESCLCFCFAGLNRRPTGLLAVFYA